MKDLTPFLLMTPFLLTNFSSDLSSGLTSATASSSTPPSSSSGGGGGGGGGGSW